MLWNFILNCVDLVSFRNACLCPFLCMRTWMCKLLCFDVRVMLTSALMFNFFFQGDNKTNTLSCSAR